VFGDPQFYYCIGCCHPAVEVPSKSRPVRWGLDAAAAGDDAWSRPGVVVGIRSVELVHSLDRIIMGKVSISVV
jgi:hypothetical protein